MKKEYHDLEIEKDALSMLVLGNILEIKDWDKDDRNILIRDKDHPAAYTGYSCRGYKHTTNGLSIGIYGGLSAVYVNCPKDYADDYFVVFTNDLGEDIQRFSGPIAEFIHKKIHKRIDEVFGAGSDEIQEEVDTLQEILEKI